MVFTIPPKPIQIFYSFAQQDAVLCEQLERHLVTLRRTGTIIDWHDRLVHAGEEVQAEIDKHLRTADIVLLLISSDFLASSYQQDDEMKLIIERYEAGELDVVPVILRSCEWEQMPFGANRTLGNLKPSPARDKPVISSAWKYPDEAFKQIAQDIRTRVETARTGKVGIPQIPVPDANLLPYLCNRSEQEKSFVKSVKEWRKERINRPLVTIVHGDDDGCHLMFQRRLRDVTLPRQLAPQSDSGPIEDFPVSLPRNYKSDKQVADFLWSELGRTLANDSEASIETVITALASYETPVMPYSFLYSEDWEPHGGKLIKAVLNFWNAFPNTPPAKLVFCLFFEYKTADGLEVEGFAETNQKVRTYFSALERRLGEYPNLQPALLPELPGVPEREVLMWITNREYFRGYCKYHPRDFCRVQAIVDGVKETYRKYSGSMPMQPLAGELLTLLDRNRCRDGV